MNITRRIFKDSVLVSIIGLVTQVVSFLIPLLIAMKFGASVETDAYYLAISIPTLLIGVIVGGSIKLVFIPIFVEELHKNPENERVIIGGSVFLLLALSFIIAALVSALVLLGVLSFSGNEELAKLSKGIVLELLPIIPISILHKLYVAVYQSRQKFGYALFSETIKAVFISLCILFLSKRIGIQSIVVGQIGGHFLAASMVAYLNWHSFKTLPFPKFIFPEGTRRMLRLSAFALGAFGIVQLSPFFSRFFAALLPTGSITIFSLAEKLVLIPSLILSGNIGAVITSHWSKQIAIGNFEDVKSSCNNLVSGIFMIIVPLTAGLIILSVPIVATLFQRGEFTAEDSIRTSRVFSILAIGFVPTYLHMVIVRILHVMKLMKALFWLSLSGVIVAIPSMYLLGIVLTLGNEGIALSIIIGSYVTFGFTTVFIQRKYKILNWKTLFVPLFKTTAATVTMSILVSIVANLIKSHFKLGYLYQFIISGVCGLLIYAILLIVFRHQLFLSLFFAQSTKEIIK